MKISDIVVVAHLYAIFFATQNILIAAMGVRSCVTPLSDPGVCISLEHCTEVLTLFTRLPQASAAQYSLALRRLCNNEVTRNNYPVVCCSRPRTMNPPVNQPPTIPSTLPPIRTTTEPAKANLPDPNQNRVQTEPDASCRTPSNEIGKCKPLRDCAPLREELIASPFDESLKQKVRSLICTSAEYTVCCVEAKQGRSFNVVNIPNEDQGCGKANQKAEKIYGGEVAEIGSWPWMALLGYDKYSYNPFRCAGSLISAKHVVSAAHCTKTHIPTFVRLGEHDMSLDNETNHLDIDISKIVSHPDFGADRRNDISLVFLENLVQFTDLIRPICLPMAAEIRRKSYVSSNPFVAGWGKTGSGSASHILMQTQLPVLDNEICHNIYQRLNRLQSENQFDDSVICAGHLRGGIDTCQGDSGGPLMAPEVYKGSQRYYLLGIVSYGIKCAEAGKPGVYTNVRHFLEWIIEHAAES